MKTNMTEHIFKMYTCIDFSLSWQLDEELKSDPNTIMHFACTKEKFHVLCI